jgi:uncharacterized protein YneR
MSQSVLTLSWITTSVSWFTTTISALINAFRMIARTEEAPLPSSSGGNITIHDLESGLSIPSCSEPIPIQGAIPRESMNAEDDDEETVIGDNDDWYMDDDETDVELEEAYDLFTFRQHRPLPETIPEDPRIVRRARTATLSTIGRHAQIVQTRRRHGGDARIEVPLRIRLLRKLITPEQVEAYERELWAYPAYCEPLSGWGFTRGRRSPPSRRRRRFTTQHQFQNDFEY